jgi:endonuclease YncB( thermonuclease family)
MRYLSLIVTLAAAFWVSSLSAEPINPRSIYVIDGDTIDISGERFRLVGFDTPETYRPQCASEKALGDQATALLKQLINSLSVTELVVQPGRDRYGRGLARLFVGGTDVGSILVNEGLARPYNGGRRAGWCG